MQRFHSLAALGLAAAAAAASLSTGSAFGAAFTADGVRGGAIRNIRLDYSGPDGNFGCVAYGFSAFGIGQFAANFDFGPCEAQSFSRPTVRLAGTEITGGTVATTADLHQVPVAGDGVSATATLATAQSTTVPGLSLHLRGLNSYAAATCTPGPEGLTMSLTCSSSIDSITLNGQTFHPGSARRTIDVGAAVVYLNLSYGSEGFYYATPVEVDVLGVPELVLGESIVGAINFGLPCSYLDNV